MANVYDQFDFQSGAPDAAAVPTPPPNPYDRFDVAPTDTGAAPASAAPLAPDVPTPRLNPYDQFDPVPVPAANAAGNPYDQFTPAPAAKPLETPSGLWSEASNAFLRDMAQPGVKTAADIIGYQSGITDPVKLAKDLASQQRQAALAPASPESQVRGSPEWLAALAGSLLPQIGETLGYTALGLPAGGIGGLVTGSSAAGLIDFSRSYVSKLAAMGVDVTNDTELYMAMTNPAIHDEAIAYAAARGGTVGVLSAATGGIAGKVLPSVAPGAVLGKVVSPATGKLVTINAPRTVLQKTAVGAAGAGIGTVGGAVSEAAAQLASTGTFEDPGGILDEALVGAFTEAPHVIAPAAGRAVKAGIKAVGPKADTRPIHHIEVIDPVAGPITSIFRGDAAGAAAHVADLQNRGQQARIVVPKPKRTVALDASGNVTFTDYDIDVSDPDVAETAELATVIGNIERQRGTGLQDTAATWMFQLDSEMPTWRQPKIAGRLRRFLTDQNQKNPNQAIAADNLWNAIADGLVADNWSEWRKTGVQGGPLSMLPLPPSMVPPLVMTRVTSDPGVTITEVQEPSLVGGPVRKFSIQRNNEFLGYIKIREDVPDAPHAIWVQEILAKRDETTGQRTLRPSGVRAVLSQLRALYPDKTHVAGYRTGGAHEQAGTAGPVEQILPGAAGAMTSTTHLLPDDHTVVGLAEGYDLGMRSTLIVQSLKALGNAELQKLITHAQDQGYERIAFTPDSELGAQLAAFLEETPEAKTIDLLFGGEELLGVLNVPEPEVVHPTDLAITTVEELGQVQPGVGSPYVAGKFTVANTTDFVTRVNQIITHVAEAMHFRKKVLFQAVPLQHGWLASASYWHSPTEAMISLDPPKHSTIQQMFTNTSHEFGHMVMYEKVYTADTRTQLALLQEFAMWRRELKKSADAGVPYRKLFASKMAVSNLVMDLEAKGRLAKRRQGLTATLGPTGLESDYGQYWASYTEWFAESVARWLSSSQRPLTVVDRFFNTLAKSLKRMLGMFYRAAGMKFEPTEAVKAYLDGFLADVDPGAFESVYAEIEYETRLKNKAALHAMGAPFVAAAAQQPETGPSREIILKLFGGKGNATYDMSGNFLGFRKDSNTTYVRGEKRTIDELYGMAAIGDKMNRFYKYSIGLYQLAQRNMHIQELQEHIGTITEAESFRLSIMNRAVETVKIMEKLSAKELEKLHLAQDDYVQMRYRTPAEVQAKTKRMPTAAELTAIWDQHGMSPEGRRAFMLQVEDYAWAIDESELAIKQSLEEEYKSLRPTERMMAIAKRLMEIEAEFAELRKSPYVPQSRWGRYTTTMKDTHGNVLFFAQDETVRQQRKTKQALQSLYPGHKIFEAELSEDVSPMLGIPRPLLELLNKRVELTETQRRYVEDLAYELSPIHSFKHHFQMKRNVAGYSLDFSRAYANYFLHFGNYLAKVKYGQRLRNTIKKVQEQSRYLPDDKQSWLDPVGLYKPKGNRRSQIANYMVDHLQEWMDPSADMWRIKGVSFFIALGFAPLGAVVNLSGLVTGSYPLLAEGFGDAASLSAIGQASARFAKHRTKITAPLTDDQLRMRQVLVTEGTIDESFAAMLAGIAEGRNLLEQVSNKKVARGYNWFMEKSSWLFQYTEKTNRIVTADAAYSLAMQYPEAKFVRESIQSEPFLFERLIREGWQPVAASAVVTAKRVVNTSQGIYSQWARPRMFRGKLGTVFQFKAFTQNLLWNIWNHKQGAIRTYLAFGLLGGLMAEPGAEDISDILKAIARALFGKDFDLERDARELLVSWAHTDPSLFLHGTASKGFGIPALLDLVGDITGIGKIPFPETDLSRRISAESISPIPLSVLLSPSDDPDAALGRIADRASGPALGLGFALYRALTDTKNQDHWLRLIPAAIRNLPKGWTALQTEELRDPYGGAIIKFDTRDTEQMMELISYALGASPTRLTTEQAADRETREVIDLWDMRQQALLRQLAEAAKSDDKEELDSVIQSIQDFNAMLPEVVKSKRITATAARSSVKQRLRREEMRERNIPYRRQDRPLADHIRQLYFPDAEEVTKLPR